MKLSRIKQLYHRRDRLQDMIDAQNEQIMALANQQIEIEKKAFRSVFPEPEKRTTEWYRWSEMRRRDANHLGDWFYRIDKWEPLNIECWGRGCRGGEDWLETAFKIDERIADPEGQEDMYRDYATKYTALKDKQQRDVKASLEAERRRLEERLRELGDQS